MPCSVDQVSRARWVLLVGILSTCYPAECWARPRLGETLKGQARISYFEARKAFGAGAWARALELFQEASRLSNDPRLVWNMAACARKLGKNAVAYGLIEQYLVVGKDWLAPDEQQEAARALEALKPFVGLLTVETEPATGVEVFSGELFLGTSPILKEFVFEPGLVQLRFRHPDFQPKERLGELARGTSSSWLVRLAPSPVIVPAAPEAPTADATGLVQTAHREFARAPWFLGAGGLVVGASGGVLAGLAALDWARYEQACDRSCNPEAWRPSRNRQLAGEAMMGVGAAAIASAVVWLVLERRNLPATLVAAPVGAGATVGVACSW